MSEKSPADVARQFAQHLESLRIAGVEFVPGTAPAELKPAPPPPRRLSVPTVTPAVQTTLLAAAPLESPPLDDLEQRRQALAELARQVSQCVRCPQLASTRTQTVFGVGPLDPELCFVGEAPGADEDRTGQPFVGAAGQLLTRILAASGLSREEVFICNILRCRPPGNRNPTPEEAGNCSEWLEKTIALVRPRYVVALGGIAATNLLGTTVGITRLRGKFYEYRGIPVLCTFHPSYLLRSPEKKKEVWEDMKTLLAKLGRPIPGKG
jgi:uracil-DNA glycosylase family 4